LTALPKVLYIVAVVLAFLALVGMPPLLPLMLSAATFYAGYTIEQRQKRAKDQGEQKAKQEAEDLSKRPETALNLMGVDTIELEVGVGLVALASGKAGQDLRDRIAALRRQITIELGLVIPPVRVRDNLDLGLNQYSIRIRGAEMARQEVRPDRLLAMGAGNLGIESAVATTDPVFGVEAFWIRPDSRDRAELVGATVIDPGSVIVTHLAEIIRRYAYDILTRQDVKSLLDHVRKSQPVVVEELIPDLLSIGEVQRVLANLLKERVSIRDLPTILETLADKARSSRDIDVLTETVRQNLGRHIIAPLLRQGVLTAVVLSPEAEEAIRNAIDVTETGPLLNLDPAVAQNLLNNLREALKTLPSGSPPVVITSPYIRLYLRRLTERGWRDLAVVSYAEIAPEVSVRTTGVVTV
ncbi:MAG: flagellar biosynthesis protein FlhA, partial [Firmicutes bacterium]|nr:flagellar biosynthesis protein FlhA [Bacillota bacterium]